MRGTVRKGRYELFRAIFIPLHPQSKINVGMSPDLVNSESSLIFNM